MSNGGTAGDVNGLHEGVADLSIETGEVVSKKDEEEQCGEPLCT